MSFGGFGSQGQIRYALIVDDQQATQKIGTFKNSLTQLAPATQAVNQNMGALANNFKGVSGGLTQQNTLLGTTINQHKTLAASVKGTFTQFSGLATGLSATATGALQLAAGFRDYNDAQIAVERVTRKNSLAHEALTKAQDKLNALQAKGITSGKEYEQAQLDVQQAQQMVEIQTQLLGEAQERLFDSQSQFVVSVIPTALGAIGSLGAAWDTLGGKMGGITGTLGKMKGALGGVTGGLGGMSGGLLGILGPAGLAAAAALLIIDRLEAMKESLKLAGVQVTQTSKSFAQALIDMDLAKFNSEMKQSMIEFDNVNKIMKATPLHLATTDWQTLRKEIEAAGGTFDKTGKLMKVTQEHVFDLGANFKESSNQWIIWMTNYRKMGESNAQVMARLKKAGFDVATATKIAAAANEDYTNSQTVKTEKDKQATTTTQELVKAIDLTNRATAYQMGTFNDTADSVGSYADEFAHAEVEITQTNKAIDLTNRAVAYQNGTFKATSDSVGSYADEFAHLEVEVKKTNIVVDTTNRALAYQADKVGSYADEVVGGIEDIGQAISEEAGKKAWADYAKSIDDAQAAFVKFNDEWEKAKDAARLDLADKLGLKGVDEKVDKLVEKITDDLPKKIGNLKIKFKLQEEIDKESIGQAAARVVMGLSEDISNDDRVADAVAKAIKENLPHTDAGDAMRKFLDNAMKNANTGEILRQHLVQDTKTGEWKLEIDVGPTPDSGETIRGDVNSQLEGNPASVEVDPALDASQIQPQIDKNEYAANITGNITQINNPWSKDLGPMSGGRSLGMAAMGESKALLSGGKTAGTVPLTGVITNVVFDPSKVPKGQTYEEGGTTYTRGSEEEARAIREGKIKGPGTSPFATMTADSQKAQADVVKNFTAMWKKLVQIFNSIGTHFSQNMAVLGQNAADANKAITQQFTATWKKSVNIFNSLGTHWSQNMGVIANNAADANKAVVKEFTAMWKKAVNIFNSLATHFSQNMADIANNARDAAKAVNNELAKIKDKTVTITYKTAGSPGRIAQHGMHENLAEDTIIQAHKGERVDIGPGHTPRASGTGAAHGGTTGTEIIHIHNHLIDRDIIRTYRRETGKEMFRFGPT